MKDKFTLTCEWYIDQIFNQDNELDLFGMTYRHPEHRYDVFKEMATHINEPKAVRVLTMSKVFNHWSRRWKVTIKGE